MTGRGHSRAQRIAVLAAAATGITLAALLGTGILGGSAGAVELPPVAKQMRAFAKPPLPTNQVPAVVRGAQDRLASGHGAPIAGQTRRLASGQGANHADVYAFPTTGGAVCVLVNERTYSSTCVDGFDRRTGNVQWMNYYGEGTPQTVAGLASDAVTGVQVVAGGAVHDATLSGNSFFWQSADPALKSIQALLVRQSDGQVVRVDLGSG